MGITVFLYLDQNGTFDDENGSNGNGSETNQNMEYFLAALNEMLSTITDRLSVANKPIDPNDVLKCLKDMDFDNRYTRKTYMHLCRNPVDYKILIALPPDERESTLRDIMMEAQIKSFET